MGRVPRLRGAAAFAAVTLPCPLVWQEAKIRKLDMFVEMILTHLAPKVVSH